LHAHDEPRPKFTSRTAGAETTEAEISVRTLPLPSFNGKDHCTSDVKPTGDYAADCETDEAYAIEFVKTCDKNYGWASLMQSITSDMIRAGSKNGIVIGWSDRERTRDGHAEG
jgi:hypothetical protein